MTVKKLSRRDSDWLKSSGLAVTQNAMSLEILDLENSLRLGLFHLSSDFHNALNIIVP